MCKRTSPYPLLISTAILAIVLAACGPSVKVRTDTAPNVDMGSYHTYGFFTKLGLEEEGGSSILGEHFRNAISTQMNSRGYRQADAPQLQINVTAATDDKVRVNTYQDPYLYGGYYGGYGVYGRGVWGGPMFYGGATRTTVTQYTQANVYIDLVDASQHKLVWQGVATFTLTDKMQQQAQQAVNNTVSEIFAKYPVPAAK